MKKHSAIHKLVWAIKALNKVIDTATLSSALEAELKWAKALVWDAGEELGIDIGKQLQRTEENG